MLLLGQSECCPPSKLSWDGSGACSRALALLKVGSNASSKRLTFTYKGFRFIACAGALLAKQGAAIERYFNVRPHQFQLNDRYNVARSIDIPVIRLVNGERLLSLMHWA